VDRRVVRVTNKHISRERLVIVIATELKAEYRSYLLLDDG